MRNPTPRSCLYFVAFAALLALSLAHCALAQRDASVAPPVQAVPAAASGKAVRYAEEAVVIERAESLYVFASDGTGRRERSIIVRVQSEADVRTFGVVAVPYAANSEQVEFLYARVRHPDGSVVETPPSEAIEMPEPTTREAPFYSDLKEKQLPIRSLRVGDTLEWKARITRTKAEAPGQFWGQENFIDGMVTLADSLELRVPVGIHVNVWSPTIQPVESDLPASAEGPAQHIYRWSSASLKPTAGKEAEAAAAAKKKTVWTAEQETDADLGKFPAVAWTTFQSWQQVGEWFRGLSADRAVASPEIKAKVAELIAGKTSDEQKARALYSYVATNIRYIGVDFGIGRYQPHNAAEILSNQFGDCKDKHTLLAAMLAAAGLHADAALIGAGIRFNEAVPSPASFNHLITRVTIADQPVWLDTTAEIAPWRVLYSTIRDRPALVVPSAAVAASSIAAAPFIARTPAALPFASTQTMDATGSLDKKGISHSRLTWVLRGDTELAVRSVFHQSSPAQYNQVVQQLSYNLSYAGTTSNAEVSHPEDTAEPFRMSYDYEREKAGDWDHYRIIPQLAPNTLPRFADSDPLVRSLDLGAPRVEVSHAAMKIPDGWGAVLPDAAHYKCAYATYDQSYHFEKGTIYTERRVEVLKQKVPTADLAAYKKWAHDANLGNDLYIQLTRNSASTPAAASTDTAKSDADTFSASDGPPVVPPGSEEAMTLLRKAGELYNQHDIDGVAKILDQVKALNPQQSYLWSMYGAVATARGQYFEAIDDLQKEIKLHPDSVRVYLPLSELQKHRGLKKDAIQTLRAWVAAAADDPTATEKLMTALIDEGDATDAMAVGEAALRHLSDDARKEETFQLALGRAQLKAGSKEKGAATLQSLLKQSQTTATLNSAAYELADASLDLAEVESFTHTAIDKLSEESRALDLNVDAKKIAEQKKLVAATWDTMGWILFREGRAVEAESYLRAAWNAEQNLEIRKHLTALATAQGRKPELDYIHQIELGNSNGRSGVDEYRLLLRDGKATEIKPVGATTISNALAIIAKAKFIDLFPTGSQIALIRLGYLNCHDRVCELILEP